jgi:CheY-like chemotaxis protein
MSSYIYSTATKVTKNNEEHTGNIDTISRFIVVDDDAINNIICSKLIKKALCNAEVKTIAIPEDALDFLESEFSLRKEPAILLLDINMPTMTGWEFMERYRKFSDEIKNQLTVYILSSSMDHHDIEKANSDQEIKSFLSKPLSIDILQKIAGSEEHRL